ncbi:conjugal transfer protein TrbJ [Legionella geestiana]|uniref:Conjugal transfer protein TrbJ n=1 Tax=Legionella geestiana TaxID=45065 RepID=A0A0W0U6Y9_9GAMM|nr:conjugal transfer protein TrbJ [Legionella geestiana]STX53790.1 Conjugal transfer protein trbJ precursor [Legionella geestiana]
MNMNPKTGFTLTFSLLLASGVFAAGTPVFDYANLIQNIRILQTETEQYRQQLLQYKALIANTSSLGRFNWDDASGTITQLLNTTDTISAYKSQAGSLQRYLDTYQSSSYYQNHPCMRGACTPEQRRALEQSRLDASNAEKKTRDAMMHGLDAQQQTLARDASRIRTLQQQAADAEGQKQAIQAATQLASSQANQLLQIRSLMVASQAAEVTREAERANREAMEAAADARLRAGTFHKSSGKSW